MCAMEISKELKNHPELRVRMGIHSGPVNEVTDLNEQANIAGAGINIAQRVMDCGDAGHILVSKRAADDLEQYRQWRPLLHELGECEVKHGVTVSIVNLYTDEVGNPALPAKFARIPVETAVSGAAPGTRSTHFRLFTSAGVAALLLLAGAVWFFSRQNVPLTSNAPARPASNPDAVPGKSIAVLPLENLSDDKENAFFADGIHDDILTSLAKISDLKVISRTSVLQYRGIKAAANLPEIARTLGVENVLEGSVRRSGNRVLVNVQLIDARNDRHIWAERYDRTIADSIGLQGELATEIASALKAKLAPEEKTRLAARPTNNAAAYELYLRAREFHLRPDFSLQNYLSAEQLYLRAIALDPNFALAHARLPP